MRKQDRALIAQWATGGLGTMAVTIGTTLYKSAWLTWFGIILSGFSHLIAGYINWCLVKSERRETIRLILESAVNVFFEGKGVEPGNIRCNVMTYHCLRGYRIFSWVGSYPLEERSLFWKPGVGVVGKAALSKSIAWADEELEALYSHPSLAAAAGFERVNLFGLTDAHFRATSQLRTIVAVPVLNENNDILAVISMDDGAPHTESHLYRNKTDVEKFLIGLAGILADFFEQ